MSDEDRFEVGKTYSSPDVQDDVTVTDANEEWAQGWYEDGMPWARRHVQRYRWTEVES